MAEQIYIEANGLRFHAWAAGASGPLVLLLHGFPELGLSWSSQLEALAMQGFRAVAPDLRGYGQSERPSGVADYDLDILAQDVVEMIRALGAEKAHIVGHDWGGGLAWHLAQRHPERVDRLAILNCPHPRELQRAVLRSPRQFLRSWYMFFFQIPWVPEWVLGWNPKYSIQRIFQQAAAEPDRFSPHELQPYVASMSGPKGWRGGINWYRAAFRGLFNRKRHQLWSQRIRSPALIIWGTSDPILGEELIASSAALLSQVDLKTLPGVGHWVQQEAPERVNELLVEFLAATPLDSGAC
jgi:pimeloyl-ACP methyl ester carboxylesterase